MRVQTYRTLKAAERYAQEIVARYPANKAVADTYVLSWGFCYAVRVTMPDGRSAWAGTRPRGFGDLSRPVSPQ